MTRKIARNDREGVRNDITTVILKIFYWGSKYLFISENHPIIIPENNTTVILENYSNVIPNSIGDPVFSFFFFIILIFCNSWNQLLRNPVFTSFLLFLCLLLSFSAWLRIHSLYNPRNHTHCHPQLDWGSSVYFLCFYRSKKKFRSFFLLFVWKRNTFWIPAFAGMTKKSRGNDNTYVILEIFYRRYTVSVFLEIFY